MTKEESTKIVNFMTPRAGVLVLGRGHISHIVKMHYFFKIFFSTPRHCSNKVYSNDDTGSVFQNCKFHDPRGRGFCARAWTYKSYSENALLFFKSSSLSPGIYQTNQVCSNDDQGRIYQNCKFHDPGAGFLCYGVAI